MIYYKRSEKEINEILKTLTIVMDSREQSTHVLDWFHDKNIPVKIQKLDVGDYSAVIPANEEFGIPRDIYLKSVVERKNSIDELCGNLGKNGATAFQAELTRSLDWDFVLFVEDEHFYDNILTNNYRSQYNNKSLLGRLDSLCCTYGFEIIPVKKELMASRILSRMHYRARHYLKNGLI